MYRRILSLAVLAMAAPVSAQIYAGRDAQEDAQAFPPVQPSIALKAPVNSMAGQFGQRHNRGDAAPNIEPLGRIQGRIANRIQSRIHNRIAKDYDAQANVANPFADPDVFRVRKRTHAF